MRSAKRVIGFVAALIAVVAAGGVTDSLAGGPATRSGRPPSRPTTPASRPVATRSGRPPSRPTAMEIRRSVRQLNHPVPARRRSAVRQLAEWGPLAFGELRRAASGSDLEAALLARDLLAELESAILIGARVRMEVNRTRIAWDEPVTLTVYAHNPTAAPIRVPWPAPKGAAATRPARDDASQVAAMLDAADFLIVTSPEGETLDLRIEPIDRDRAVYEAVDVRARGTPPSHLVEPGRTARLDVPLFNRGWARYPMLSAGRYTIAFSYQPKWKDPSWTEEGFGRVAAEPITVEVREEAPELVRKSNRPLTLRLSRDGDVVVARLQSTWDLPQWINVNLGSELAVHGRLEWRLLPMRDGVGDTAALALGPEATLPVFRPDRIRQLAPGKTLTLARVPVATLRDRARGSPVDQAGTFELNARYVHVARPEQLRQQLPASSKDAKIPTHIFAGSVGSDPILLEFRQAGP